VREEIKRLKHRANRAAIPLQADFVELQRLAVDCHRAFIGVLQPGNDPQQRGFAAPRRTDHH